MKRTFQHILLILNYGRLSIRCHMLRSRVNRLCIQLEALKAFQRHGHIIFNEALPDTFVGSNRIIEMQVRVNGKLCEVIVVPEQATDEEIKAQALSNNNVQACIGKKGVVYVDVILRKLVSIICH